MTQYCDAAILYNFHIDTCALGTTVLIMRGCSFTSQETQWNINVLSDFSTKIALGEIEQDNFFPKEKSEKLREQSEQLRDLLSDFSWVDTDKIQIDQY